MVIHEYMNVQLFLSGIKTIKVWSKIGQFTT